MGDWADEDEVSESLEVSISFSVTVNTKNPLYTQTNKQTNTNENQKESCGNIFLNSLWCYVYVTLLLLLFVWLLGE